MMAKIRGDKPGARIPQELHERTHSMQFDSSNPYLDIMLNGSVLTKSRRGVKSVARSISTIPLVHLRKGRI
jgi:hypothetical protein